MKIAVLIGALILAACGGAPGVEQAHQHYWKCWKMESVLYAQFGADPHVSDVVPNPAQRDCLDAELIAGGFTHDGPAETGGWRYNPHHG